MSCLPSFVLPPWRKTRLSWTSALTWVSNFAMSIHFHVLVSSAGKGIILWSTRLGIQTTHKMWDSMTSLMTNLQFIAEWWHRTGMFNGQLLSCYIAGTLLASCISHVFQPGSLARRPKDLRKNHLVQLGTCSLLWPARQRRHYFIHSWGKKLKWSLHYPTFRHTHALKCTKTTGQAMAKRCQNGSGDPSSVRIVPL